MESFWLGILVKGVLKEKQDLLVKGEKIGLPLAENFILEREPSDFSKDLELRREKITARFLKEKILNKYLLFGMKFNPKMKRNEIVHVALPNGWCWDET